MPQPGLSDQPQSLARVHIEGHALHGVQLSAVRQVEPDVEVAGLEERHGVVPGTASVLMDRCATRRRGLSASSIAWPMR